MNIDWLIDTRFQFTESAAEQIPKIQNWRASNAHQQAWELIYTPVNSANDKIVGKYW
jgi:hypothetical protein